MAVHTSTSTHGMDFLCVLSTKNTELLKQESDLVNMIVQYVKEPTNDDGRKLSPDPSCHFARHTKPPDYMDFGKPGNVEQ